MNQRPLTADEARETRRVSVAVHDVQQLGIRGREQLDVRRTEATLAQTIRMGQLVRGTAGGCDTVQLIDWTHTMNAADGRDDTRS